jgi:hypothetical protein
MQEVNGDVNSIVRVDVCVYVYSDVSLSGTSGDVKMHVNWRDDNRQ